jgi:hypothetical protein
MKALDPDEILDPGFTQTKKELVHVNPWRRLLARFFDYALFFLFLGCLRTFVPFTIEEHFIPFEFFLWIPVESALLVFFGTTPGKFFLGTRLRPNSRYRFDWMGAFRRSFSVWIRGLGCGIAVVNFFCLLNAYNKLLLLKTTSWDRDDHIIVTHHPIGSWRIYIASAVVIFSFFYHDRFSCSLLF